MLRFEILILTARLPSFLALLGMVRYAPRVAEARVVSNGMTDVLIDISGSVGVAKVVAAWLRTIPGIETVRIFEGAKRV